MNKEKLTLNLPYLERKADSFATNEYVVEKALPVSNSRFRQIIEAPMKDHKEIEDCRFVNDMIQRFQKSSPFERKALI